MLLFGHGLLLEMPTGSQTETDFPFRMMVLHFGTQHVYDEGGGLVEEETFTVTEFDFTTAITPLS